MENESYRTQGTLFFVEGTSGSRAIIGMDACDYPNILALDIDNVEVRLTLEKVDYGSEYAQYVPSHEGKAGIYTIKIDGSTPKFQLDMDPDNASRMRDKGFRDGERVKLTIEKLPYKSFRTSKYSDLKMDIGRLN